jgi:hypothetical protein
MPEEIEVDTDKLREAIDDEIEKVGEAGARMLRMVALYTAVLAAVTAVVSLHAGSTVNEALVLKSEATSIQARASDQWAYYQAKGIKAAIALNAAQSYAAAGRAAPDSLAGQANRYTREQNDIQTEARKLEAERDDRSREADALLEKHHRYAFAVALLQVAIALGAVAALTRQKAAFAASVVAGVVGAGLGVITALR